MITPDAGKDGYSMFCNNCGKKIEDGAAFCEFCGAKLTEEQPAQQPAAEQQTAEQPAEQQTPAEQPAPEQTSGEQTSVTAPAKEELTYPKGPRYSERLTDPEIVAYVEKIRKTGIVWACILVPLPLVITVVLSFFVEKFPLWPTALASGGFISLVFLVCNLVSLWKTSPKRAWEGTVTGKRKRSRTKRGDKSSPAVHYMEYVLEVRTNKGKKKIREDDRGSTVLHYYDYFDIGEQVRFLPMLPYPYEKLDKTRDTVIPCNMCCAFVDIRNDRCPKCGKPLFK